MDHVLRALDLMLGRMEALERGADAAIRPAGRPNWMGRIILWTGRIPRGRGEAPAETVPDPRPVRHRLRESLTAVALRAGALAERAGRLAEIPGVLPHPLLGDFDLPAWARFAAVHTRHHLAIVARIDRHRRWAPRTRRSSGERGAVLRGARGGPLTSPAGARPGSPVDAYTAHHHLRAVAGVGVLSGVFLLNGEFVRGTLGGSRWHVLALLLVPSLAQLVAVVRNPLDPDRGLVRTPFRAIAIPFHLLLLLPLLGLLPADPTPVVALLAGGGVIEALLGPVQNGILARNYGERTRGRRFGAATAVSALVIMAVSWPAGWILDHDPGAWRWLYAVAGLSAAWGYRNWSRAPPPPPPPAPPHLEAHASPWAALRKDRHFLAFEACFMTYGLGFLMMVPVLPLYLIDELKVTYQEVGLARGVVFWLAVMIGSLGAGRLADRIGVLRLGAALLPRPLPLPGLPAPPALRRRAVRGLRGVRPRHVRGHAGLEPRPDPPRAVARPRPPT